MKRTNTLHTPQTISCWENETTKNQSLEKMSWLLPPRAKQPPSSERLNQSWSVDELCASCSTTYNMIPPNTLSIAGDEHWARTLPEQISSLVPAAGCSKCVSTRSRWTLFFTKIHSKRADEHQVVRLICTICERKLNWQRNKTKKRKSGGN